ncbi:heparinase II/III domain-containing protein [Halogranum rubrum]|uniref:Heparinase II/III-like C-terminal domain-containing protein n=1 Tax=Halogranum salarium B-1 TaxID=1210908 RepID=J3EZY8_9EURY|nr:heparinase II/III family protein [Halogranum salarium]EJN61257.1 hypothetical protein HSB1_02980 [Halogranum salarium B-1]
MAPNDAESGDPETTDSATDTERVLEALNPPLVRRDFLKTAGSGVLAALVSGTGSVAAQSPRKTRASYYTEAKRQAARENIAAYSWARSMRDRAVDVSETILEQFTLDDLWHYVGSQHIPRAAYLAEGTAGYYPWSSEWSVKYPASGVSYAAKPGRQWKSTNGEYTLPTNDFEAYRRSGLDDTGAFDPTRADDSLLVNEEHPEMGPTWGVDDGLGWVDEAGDLGPAGTRWAPVAWAHHWHVVYGVRALLDPLYKAYLYTDDKRYARPVAVLLDRLADVYPDMDLQNTTYFTDGGYTERNGFPNPTHGGTGQGKQIGSIWESYWVKSVMKAYDAVFPALDVDSTLTAFLDQKTTQYPGLPAKNTTNAVRTNIEEGFVKQMLPGVKNAQIRGNFGSHQQTLALSAVVQDDQGGYTDETLDFLFKAGELKKESDGTAFGHWYITGGGVLSRLLTDFDRDGFANEESVQYNGIVSGGLQGTADVLNGYTGYTNADLYQTPQFKRTFLTQSQLTYLDQYNPRLGDTAGAGKPGFGNMLDPDNLVRAYQTYENLELVKWIYLRNGKSTSGLRGSIFDPDPNAVSDDIDSVLSASGPLDLASTQLAGFGLTALRAGDTEAGTGRGVWTYYGRNAYGPDSGYGTSHCHRDALNIGLFGHGLNLSPDLGYPEETGDWPKRWNWTSNTISHNTVVVDEQKQDRQYVGSPTLFDHTDRVQVFDVESNDAYRETTQYRRTTGQVTVDAENSYVVDFFRVDGGDDHHFSFHGPAGPATQFEYSLRPGVSEFVVRQGSGGVGVSREHAYQGDWSTVVYDPSGGSHEWRGLAVATESNDRDVRVYVNAAPTGTYDYWQHVQAVYLGRDSTGRHVCAGVGNHGSGQDPRIGLYYPEDDEWVSYDSMADWEKDTWYALDVSVRGSTVDISLQSPTDGNVHATGSYQLPSETEQMVGIFGALGEGQTGELFFDGFTLDGAQLEFLDSEFGETRTVTTTGLSLTEQSEGTYAGIDVPKPGHGEDTAYNDAVGNGFNYLYDVERDTDPSAQFSAEWDVRDHWDTRSDNAEDVKLRLTMLTACDDVVLASGDPPQRWNNPETFKYLVAHRRVLGGSSTFQSVIEAYDGERFVESVTAVPVTSDDPTARAVRVTLTNGRTDYVASAPGHAGESTEHTVDGVFTFDGAFAVYSVDASGNHEHAYLLDGSTLTVAGETLLDHRSRIEGVVEDFTRSLSLDNELQIRVTNGAVDSQLLAGVVGSWVYADAVDERNGAYEIVGVENVTSTTATLKLGELTTVKQFSNPDNPSAGYEYLLRENGDVVIPLSTTWSN